jgi:hypothetical protein
MSSLTEDQWVKYSEAFQSQPPMPWWLLHDMNREDRKAPALSPAEPELGAGLPAGLSQHIAFYMWLGTRKCATPVLREADPDFLTLNARLTAGHDG